MSVAAVLLRLLLSLAIVLNGAGNAMASVPMQGGAMPLHYGQQDDRAGTAASAHCAGHEMTMPAALANAVDGSGQAPDRSEQSMPDCCKSSACRCACAHACSSLMPAAAQAFAMIAHEMSIGAMSIGYRAPALPHLIRPPIA